MSKAIEIRELRRHFPENKGWQVVEIERGSVDSRPNVFNTPIKCIDRDFGFTADGYDPNLVPLAPALPGAVDGVASFLNGEPEERMQEAAKRTISVGYIPAYHGDYARGDDGCAYRRAIIEGRFEGLPPITKAEHRVLTTKMGLHYVQLHRPEIRKVTRGFILNEDIEQTVLPDAGSFYPIDIGFAREVGLSDEQTLPVIAKCGELLLPRDNKVLFVVRD